MIIITSSSRANSNRAILPWLQPLRVYRTRVFGLRYNTVSLLCYFPFGIIIALALLLSEPKENRFVRFHAIQSLLLNIITVFAWEFVSALFAACAYLPVVGWVYQLMLSPFFLLIPVTALVLAASAAVSAYRRHKWQIPYIGVVAGALSG